MGIVSSLYKIARIAKRIVNKALFKRSCEA